MVRQTCLLLLLLFLDLALTDHCTFLPYYCYCYYYWGYCHFCGHWYCVATVPFLAFVSAVHVITTWGEVVVSCDVKTLIVEAVSWANEIEPVKWISVHRFHCVCDLHPYYHHHKYCYYYQAACQTMRLSHDISTFPLCLCSCYKYWTLFVDVVSCTGLIPSPIQSATPL